jgi:hypothetical protein
MIDEPNSVVSSMVREAGWMSPLKQRDPATGAGIWRMVWFREPSLDRVENRTSLSMASEEIQFATIAPRRSWLVKSSSATRIDLTIPDSFPFVPECLIGEGLQEVLVPHQFLHLPLHLSDVPLIRLIEVCTAGHYFSGLVQGSLHVSVLSF